MIHSPGHLPITHPDHIAPCASQIAHPKDVRQVIPDCNGIGVCSSPRDDVDADPAVTHLVARYPDRHLAQSKLLGDSIDDRGWNLFDGCDPASLHPANLLLALLDVVFDQLGISKAPAIALQLPFNVFATILPDASFVKPARVVVQQLDG